MVYICKCIVVLFIEDWLRPLINNTLKVARSTVPACPSLQDKETVCVGSLPILIRIEPSDLSKRIQRDSGGSLCLCVSGWVVY